MDEPLTSHECISCPEHSLKPDTNFTEGVSDCEHDPEALGKTSVD